MSIAVVISSKLTSNLSVCISHVHRYDPGCRIVVVDDTLIGYRPPADVAVLLGAKPFCFAVNCNRGITYAFEDPECDGVVLLNDDALLMTPGGFTRMEVIAEQHPEVGILSATCNRVGNPNQKPHQHPAFRYDVRVLAFVCVYIPRLVIEKLGMLDERFTAYGCEDCDYCKRVLDAGLKLAITEECFVDHMSLPSSFRTQTDKPALLREGRRIYAGKWGVQP